MRLVIAIFIMMLGSTHANADPVSALIAGLTAGSAGFLGGGVINAIAFSIGSFLTTTLGSLLVTVGLAYLNKPKKPGAPSIEDALVNTRIGTPERWQAGATVALGGSALFGEHDADGNFWYIMAHADAEITGTPTYYFDDIEVTIDGSNDITTDEFTLTSGYDRYEGTGTQVPYFRLWTITPDNAADFGALPAAFTTAFPNLPADFKLAGVAYTLIRCKSVPPQHYSKIMRFRGVFGLGEPSIRIVANFNRMYDPREAGHDIDDDTTWTASDGNPAIVWAWWYTQPYGRNRAMTDVNWTEVEAAADLCDVTVLDRTASSIPRYRCGVAFPDSKPRQECEADILESCDGFVAKDSAGLSYPVIGVYAAPTLSIYKTRDVLTSTTLIIDDGERAIDGVIVNYMSAAHKYTKQPCAPWVNDTYYDGTSEARYLVVDRLSIQNHNQAVRLAKAIGRVVAPTKKIALQMTIKGILARNRLAIDLDYDADFTGYYKIATPVELDSQGTTAAFAAVPFESDHYDLGVGEEGAPPPPDPVLNIDKSLSVAVNMVITSESVATSSGAGVRFFAVFTAPTRTDRIYQIRYTLAGGTSYEYFFVDMDEAKGYSSLVLDDQAYDIQWQTVTASGRASGWAADVGGGETVYNITATANPTAPADLIASNGVPGAAGEIDYSFTTANDANQASVKLYRGSTTTFGSATLIDTVVAAANAAATATETGIVAGTWYVWLAPANGSGVIGNESGPYTVVVT